MFVNTSHHHHICYVLSLVDKNLLTYSISERSWVWDIDDICAEHITPNVLDLLSAKLANLSENIQVSDWWYT